MDFAELTALATQARRYTDAAQGASFSLCRPTVDAFRGWVRAHRTPDGAVDWDALLTERLPACIEGWSGVTLAHFGGEAGTAVPYTPDAARLLMADNKAVQIHLFRGLMDRMNAKLAALEPDEKNSSGVSTPG